MKNERTTKSDLRAKLEIARISRVLILGFAGMIATTIGIQSYSGGRESMREDAVEAVGSALYDPVGNGGALAAMYGKVSPSRKAMYEARSKAINSIYHLPR